MRGPTVSQPPEILPETSLLFVSPCQMSLSEKLDLSANFLGLSAPSAFGGGLAWAAHCRTTAYKASLPTPHLSDAPATNSHLTQRQPLLLFLEHSAHACLARGLCICCSLCLECNSPSFLHGCSPTTSSVAHTLPYL